MEFQVPVLELPLVYSDSKTRLLGGTPCGSNGLPEFPRCLGLVHGANVVCVPGLPFLMFETFVLTKIVFFGGR